MFYSRCSAYSYTLPKRSNYVHVNIKIDSSILQGRNVILAEVP